MEYINFIKQKYSEQQRTGKSRIKFPVLTKRKLVQKSKILLTQQQNPLKVLQHVYRCGHSPNSSIIKTDDKTLNLYSEWLSNNPDGVCLKCWIENRNVVKV